MPLNSKAIAEAVKQAKEKSKRRKFVQSIELIINLKDIDPKKPEGRIQELIELPHPPGRKNKICVFASGDLAIKARDAGADLVISREELETFIGDKKRQRSIAKNYDFFLAEAPLMPLVGRALGPILGPKGKMPTPVPMNADIAEHINKRRRTVLLRVRGQPVLQCRIGSEDMPDEHIVENIQTVLERIEGKLKRGIKNIESIYIKTAMGEPVKVQMRS